MALLLLFGGLFLLFFGLVVSAATALQSGQPNADGPAVGVVEITGVIEDATPVMEALRDFADDDEIKGILVRVDSPGGAVGPSQEIYTEVVRTRARKKVVASLAGTAASGGYYAICGADRIVANPGTLTGSIGVITEIAQLDQVLGLLRVNTETFKSGELKDTGSPLRPLAPADRALLQGVVDNIYEQFRTTVLQERKLTPEALALIRDGRVLTGQQAKELGLVDELGNLHDAVAQLVTLAKLEGTPRLVHRKKKTDELIRELIDQGVGSLTQAMDRHLRPRMELRLPEGF